MQKESDAAEQQHSVSVFLARRCFFRSRRRRPATLSRSLGAPARARATPRLLHAMLRLLSRDATRYLTVKIYGEEKPARAHSRRPAAVRGGREIAREIHP